MNLWLAVWEALCVAGLALSVRSVWALGIRSPYTIAGWLFTAAYFFIAAYDARAHARAPFHADYAAVAALTLAFGAAGLRREPQAEPWWWPRRQRAP